MPASFAPLARAATSALRTSAASSSTSSASSLRSLPALRTLAGRPTASSSVLSARAFSSSPISLHGLDRPEPGTGIKITFKEASGRVIRTVEANEGDDILSIAHEHDIDLEGACERSCACSTCHVILDPDVYDRLPEPTDEENDMLDLAFGLTDTSRLGCQVLLTKDVDGLVATIPSATRNMFVDGSKPTKH